MVLAADLLPSLRMKNIYVYITEIENREIKWRSNVPTDIMGIGVLLYSGRRAAL